MLLFRLEPLVAADAELPGAAPDFLIDAWTSDDGLPQNSVISMAQTTDGYLWLSTFSGLARFDGTGFEVFDGDHISELSGEIIYQMVADGDDRLWLRSVHSRILVGQNGLFRQLGEGDGLPSGPLFLAADAQGTMWLGDDKGRLLQYTRGHFVVVQGSPPTPDWGGMARFDIDTAGVVWTWKPKACARLADGKWSVILQVQGEEGDIGTVHPLRDGSGVLLTRGNPDRLVRYANGRFSDLGPIPLRGYSILPMAEDPTGELWMAKNSGVMRRGLDGLWSELSPKAGFPSDMVRCEFMDRECNRWFGTDGGGLVRVKHRAAQAFGVAEGMSKKVALSVSGDGVNSIWVAALAGGVDHFDGTRFAPAHFPGDLPWCIRSVRGGGIWLGTFNDGLFLLDSEGTQRKHFRSDDHQGLISGPIQALFEAADGDLWIGGERGLTRYAAGRFHSWSATNGLADNQVNAIEEDRSDAIWIGTEAGLNRMKGGEITRFTVADGLAENAVRALCRDSQGGLWIGGFDLTRFKGGRFSAIRAANGLFVNNIKAMIEDDPGYLWFSTPHGILRASLRQLNEFCDTRKGRVDFMLFTKADGLPSNECSGYEPAAWKGGDGRLWFPTLNGVAVIDPKHLPENKVPPPVAIETVVADDKPLALPFGHLEAGPDGAQMRIPAGTARLDFRFASLSFTAPEKNRFRYRLEGFDADWSQAGPGQTASYTRPPPGDYHFHVSACNNDGVWNESGAVLALTVLPLFWQTDWFRMLVVAMTGGLIYWIFRTRLAQVERRRLVQESFARQVIETQEVERQRIAQELHDGVGQILLLVKNHLSLGMKNVEPSSPILEHLGRASSVTSQAIEEVRATARALRPVELDCLGLGKALEAMIERIGATTTARYSFELDDVEESIGREVEIQLYRIAQEAMNNVLKHSKADRVIVELKQEAKDIRLTVQDNGAGFDPALSGRQGAFGLPGMAERARLIGGALSVMAAPGKGCRLTVTVPLVKQRHE
jgi:signal transduction histidine kinase/ligand-binding sensor domain-containing protein